MHSESIEPPRLVAAVAGTGFEALLGRLAIPVDSNPPRESYRLVESEGVLELRPPGEGGRAGIRAHFPPDRKGPGGQRAHPLVRAFGAPAAAILDLTAGLGSDAYRLAEAGHRVRACERDPVVFALLVTSWEEACRLGRVPPQIASRLEFIHADARELLASIEDGDYGEDGGSGAGATVGVYLDPMYPPKRSATALPRREIQVLRQLLGGAQDAAALLALARARAARVVVKRPHHAPALASGASFVLESKLVRFDVYLDPRRMGTKTA
jgi:16S rRNA (guanine1516-N2)-methyltransferase